MCPALTKSGHTTPGHATTTSPSHPGAGQEQAGPVAAGHTSRWAMVEKQALCNIAAQQKLTI